MEMKQKLLLLGGAAALGLVPALMGQGGGQLALSGLTAPFRGIGAGLRALSLSGRLGNLAAWGVVLAVSALPVIFLAWFYRRHRRAWADWLLVLGVPVLFYMLYYMVNPTLLRGPAFDVLGTELVKDMPLSIFLAGAVGSLLALAVAWLVLRGLRAMDAAPMERLADSLRGLLTVGAALTAFGVVCGDLAALLERCAAVKSGNSGPMTGELRLTIGILGLLALLEMAPGLLAALTLLWGADLSAAVGGQTFGQETLELCGRTAAGCRWVAQVTVLLAAFANLLQLSLVGTLRDSRFSVSLPLFPLLLSVALFLLCRCLQRGKALQDDSDSII